MASVSASHMVIFIASVIIALSVSAVFTTQVLQVSDASRSSAEDLADKIRGDITIINDPASVPYDGTNLTLYVKNTGSSVIPVDSDLYDVLIDGQYKTSINASLIKGSGESWSPGEVIEINVTDSSISSGDYEVKVVAGSAEDKMEIRVE